MTLVSCFADLDSYLACVPLLAEELWLLFKLVWFTKLFVVGAWLFLSGADRLYEAAQTARFRRAATDLSHSLREIWSCLAEPQGCRPVRLPPPGRAITDPVTLVDWR
jgi:hypothetical protein